MPRAETRFELMKLFTCPACACLIFFENSVCTACGGAISYQPFHDTFHVLTHAGARGMHVQPDEDAPRFRPCRNRTDHDACNWSVPAADPWDYCLACRLNEVIPNLTMPGAKAAWFRLERAKRHLIHTLIRLRLPVAPRNAQTPQGLIFAFKQDGISGETVVTGHSDGLITINIAEADDAWRETTRVRLGEPYRTLLGHFRHESGHYYWDRLIRDGGKLEAFRSAFGDERADYAEALERHHGEGAAVDWPGRFISAYASAHPWEDWAETWAHYLHMVDTVETARSYGLTLHPSLPDAIALPTLDARAQSYDTFSALIAAWIPLTLALNSFNRGLGLNDAYPFALSKAVIAKLRVLNEIISALP